MLRIGAISPQAEIRSSHDLPADIKRRLPPQMRAQLGTFLLNLSYGFFLLLYVAAAAAYGLTRESEITAFGWAMGGVFFLWLLAHIVRGVWPHTGIAPWIVSGLVLLFGWLVTALAMINDAVIDGHWEGWDEGFLATLLDGCAAYDSDLSWRAMIRTSALLAGMIMAVAVWKHPRWSKGLILTMITSAFGMVIFFFAQRIIGGAFLLHSEDRTTTLAFATYRYWGNSASYLNLFWPIAASVMVSAVVKKTYAWPLWIIPFALIFTANFINVSKAGNVLAIIGALIFLSLALPACIRELKRSNQRFRPSYLVGALVPLLVIAVSLPFALPWKRWEYIANTHDAVNTTGRLHAYSSFLRILPDSGWMGFGPGAFKKYYFSYVEDDPKLRNQPYWVAHEDYIQTWIEWGYLGTILWSLVLVPPFLLLCRASRLKPNPTSRSFEGYRIGIIDHGKAFLKAVPAAREPWLAIGALVGILLTSLHATVDFPMQIASLQLYFLTLIALGWSYLSRGMSSSNISD